MSETNEQSKRPLPVPYSKIEWKTLADAARLLFPDEDKDRAYRRIRNWVDSRGKEVAPTNAKNGEYVEDRIRCYREDSEARNAKRFVAFRDAEIYLFDHPVVSEPTSTLVPLSTVQDIQDLNERLILLTKDATNAQREAEFQASKARDYKEERDEALKEAERLKAENEEREQAERSALEERMAAIEQKLNEPDVIDLRHEQETQPGWFKRMFKGSTPPVNVE